MKEQVQNIPNNITQFYLYAFPLTFIPSDNIVSYTYKDYAQSGNIPTLDITTIKTSNDPVAFFNDCMKEITKSTTPKKRVTQRTQ